MDELTKELIKFGIGGVVAGIFIYLYLKEREANRKLQDDLLAAAKELAKYVERKDQEMAVLAQKNTDLIVVFGREVVSAVNRLGEIVDTIEKREDKRERDRRRDDE